MTVFLSGKFKLAEPPKAPAKPKVKKEKPGPATSAEKKAKVIFDSSPKLTKRHFPS